MTQQSSGPDASEPGIPPHSQTEYDPEILGPRTDESMLSQLPDIDPRHLIDLAEAAACRDLARATRIARDGWYDLLLGNREELRRCLENMAPGIARDAPLLSMLLGLAYYAHPYLRVKGIRYFVSATRAANHVRSELNPVDRALILVSAGTAYRLVGLPERAATAAESAWKILLRLSEEERNSVKMITGVFAQLGMTLYAAGRVDGALDAFEHGLAEAPTQGYRYGFSNLSMLAGVHALNGEMATAEEYLEYARAGEWPPLFRSTYSGTFYRIAEALAALERFDTATARAHLEAMIHDRRTIEFWIDIAITEALVEMLDGRPGEAKARIHAFTLLRKGQGRSAVSRARLAPTRALLQLALGNPATADALLQRHAATGAVRNIALARVRLAQGRHGAALQYIRATSGEDLPARARAEAMSIEGAALLRFSEPARVAPLISHLGGLLERTHQRVALSLLPEADFQRLAHALLEGGFGDIVGSLPARAAIPDADASVQLTEREFVVMQALMTHSSASSIAAAHFVSPNTVKTQLKSLYRKLGVSTRDEAIAVAIDRHLIVDVPLPREDGDL